MKHGVQLTVTRHLTSALTIEILAALWVLRGPWNAGDSRKNAGYTPPDDKVRLCKAAVIPTDPCSNAKWAARSSRLSSV